MRSPSSEPTDRIGYWSAVLVVGSPETPCLKSPRVTKRGWEPALLEEVHPHGDHVTEGQLIAKARRVARTGGALAAVLDRLHDDGRQLPRPGELRPVPGRQVDEGRVFHLGEFGEEWHAVGHPLL